MSFENRLNTCWGGLRCDELSRGELASRQLLEEIDIGYHKKYYICMATPVRGFICCYFYCLGLFFCIMDHKLVVFHNQ